jgi:hypothetical protein
VPDPGDPPESVLASRSDGADGSIVAGAVSSVMLAPFEQREACAGAGERNARSV